MKYVNRDEIIKAVKEAMCPMDYPSELRDSIARTIVSASESIDIVHCKDCKYCSIDFIGDHKCDSHRMEVIEEDDFCSYGVKKDERNKD